MQKVALATLVALCVLVCCPYAADAQSPPAKVNECRMLGLYTETVVCSDPGGCVINRRWIVDGSQSGVLVPFDCTAAPAQYGVHYCNEVEIGQCVWVVGKLRPTDGLCDASKLFVTMPNAYCQ